MTDKRAFEAKLRAAINAAVYNGNVHGRGGVVSAEDRKFLADQEAAVLAAYEEAAGREGQQEPVACIVDDGQERELCWWDEGYSGDVTKLYTHPAPKADAAADWVCVPREPTAHMCHEGHAVGYGYTKNAGYDYNGADHAQTIYRAMLAASPAPGAEKDAERYRLIRSECWVTVPDDEDKLADTALDEWCDKTLAEYAAMSGGKGAG